MQSEAPHICRYFLSFLILQNPRKEEVLLGRCAAFLRYVKNLLLVISECHLILLLGVSIRGYRSRREFLEVAGPRLR